MERFYKRRLKAVMEMVLTDSHDLDDKRRGYPVTGIDEVHYA